MIHFVRETHKSIVSWFGVKTLLQPDKDISKRACEAGEIKICRIIRIDSRIANDLPLMRGNHKEIYTAGELRL